MTRGWLGVYIQDDTKDIAGAFSIPARAERSSRTYSR